jgi:hypothetical protein
LNLLQAQEKQEPTAMKRGDGCINASAAEDVKIKTETPATHAIKGGKPENIIFDFQKILSLAMGHSSASASVGI